MVALSITSISSPHADGQSCGQVECRISTLACWFRHLWLSPKRGRTSAIIRHACAQIASEACPNTDCAGFACCPCFEALAALAPQHEVVLFQHLRPHPEEAAKRSSRRMGLQYRFVIPGTTVFPSESSPWARRMFPDKSAP